VTFQCTRTAVIGVTWKILWLHVLESIVSHRKLHAHTYVCIYALTCMYKCIYTCRKYTTMYWIEEGFEILRLLLHYALIQQRIQYS